MLVTGAARGIGESISRLLSAQGANVVCADLDLEACDRLATDLQSAIAVRLDVSSEAGWHDAIVRTQARFGALDGLVNNAGIYKTLPIEDTSASLFTRMFEVNQLGVFLGMKSAVSVMKSTGGSIVNVSSTSGLRGNENSMAYGATKWAVRGMSKVAAIELAKYQIRVNSIHPGLIETPMTSDAYGRKRLLAQAAKTPFGRAAQPREVASLIAFLLSDDASFCSGGEYACDGALSAGVARPSPHVTLDG